MKLSFKKAAMFGLDARIALAIFGALSVISGAALYSAIQQAKVISTIAMMQEFAKAYEQYILDTGVGMPANSSHAIDTSSQNLVSNDANVSNWNGPYLPYSKTGSVSLSINSNGILYGYFQRAGIEDWDSTTGAATLLDCDGTRVCHIWVTFRTDAHAEDLFKAMDEYVDGGDGFHKGKLRYSDATSSSIRYVKFLVGPSLRKTQN